MGGTSVVKAKDLVPLKRVLEDVGVSRSTLWRALRSGIAHFPPPTIIRRRVYWNASELPGIETALEAYNGRCAFDARQSQRRLELEKPYRDALARMARPGRRNPTTVHIDDFAQPDLFRDLE